ncbi:MAG: ABC transporter ATP-binding protein [Burkholderiaceae bacterium]
MTGSILLEAVDLELAAGPRTLASGLALRIEAGQFWAVVGANGVGKTTLLGVLAGLAAPRRGRVEIGGHALGSLRPAEAARRRGFLPQHVEAAFDTSVLQSVLLGRHPHRHPGAWRLWESDRDEALARDALARVDLKGFEDRDLSSLSGGERQRAAIAALLAQAPALYLLDEPLAHLDLRHQHAVMVLLHELASAGDCAVVASVHDLSLAARHATHALVMASAGCVAGLADAVLTEATLSAAFGHPVRRLSDGATVALVGQ